MEVLKLNELLVLEGCKFIKKWENGLTPNAFNYDFKYINVRKAVNCSSRKLYSNMKSDIFKNIVDVRNMLAVDIEKCSVNNIGKNMKVYFLQKYYSVCDLKKCYSCARDITATVNITI